MPRKMRRAGNGRPTHRQNANPTLRKGATPAETATYIRDMTDQLRGLATGAQLDLLAYLLDMVCEEADSHIR